MTKKVTKSRKKHPHKSKKKETWRDRTVPIVVTAIALVLLVSVGLLYRFPATGQAYNTGEIVVSYDYGTDGALPLNADNNIKVETFRVQDWVVVLESSLGDLEEYDVIVTEDGDDIEYTLKELGESGRVIAIGRLGPQLADTRGILVDDDAIADIEFHYANGVFEMISLKGVGSGIVWELYRDGELRDPDKNLPKLVSEIAGYGVTYQLAVDMLPADILNVTVDGAELENVPYDITDNAAKIQFSVKQGPQELKLFLQKNGGVINYTKTYTIGGNGLVYELDDPNYPNMKVVLTDTPGIVDVTYTFKPEDVKQPFSLPCVNTVSVEELFFAADLELGEIIENEDYVRGVAITSYNPHNQLSSGFRYELPSEFNDLDPFKGYSISSRSWYNRDSDVLTFKTTCTLEETTQFPSLLLNWNLVAITGIYPATNESLLAAKGVGLTKITEIKEMLKNDQSADVDSSVLEPGKAYWVKVE